MLGVYVLMFEEKMTLPDGKSSQEAASRSK